MFKLIAVTNLKGGVGKTTTSTSIAKGLADKGHRAVSYTHLIDCFSFL